MQCNPWPSVKNLVKYLLFTHNTLLSVLYSMIVSTDTRYIRCCDFNGHIHNLGAQFRYGLDSQYGEIVFIMKPDFWKGMKGVNYKSKSQVEHIVAGHIHQHDFIEYAGPGNENLIDRWLEMDAMNYDFRKPITPGSHFGSGKECKHHDWAYSWCNIQLHIGENVGFEHVEKVYVPTWLISDTGTIKKIEEKGVNITLLRLLVTNQLPNYPYGDQAPNPLNGRFRLYGPPRASHHYHIIQKERHKLLEDPLSHHTYEAIELAEDSGNQTIPTSRHAAHSSSTVFMHERAFRDLEVRYVENLIRHGFKQDIVAEGEEEGEEGEVSEEVKVEGAEGGQKHTEFATESMESLTTASQSSSSTNRVGDVVATEVKRVIPIDMSKNEYLSNISSCRKYAQY